MSEKSQGIEVVTIGCHVVGAMLSEPQLLESTDTTIQYIDIMNISDQPQLVQRIPTCSYFSCAVRIINFSVGCLTVYHFITTQIEQKDGTNNFERVRFTWCQRTGNLIVFLDDLVSIYCRDETNIKQVQIITIHHSNLYELSQFNTVNLIFSKNRDSYS